MNIETISFNQPQGEAKGFFDRNHYEQMCIYLKKAFKFHEKRKLVEVIENYEKAIEYYDKIEYKKHHHHIACNKCYSGYLLALESRQLCKISKSKLEAGIRKMEEMPCLDDVDKVFLAFRKGDIRLAMSIAEPHVMKWYLSKHYKYMKLAYDYCKDMLEKEEQTK